MNGNRRQFTSVKGVTDVIRMPRVGKIHLGFKDNNGTHEFPRETDYFVCPQEVHAVCGGKPTELDIVFPVNSEAAVFPQAYKMYFGPTLVCKGDGESGVRIAGHLGAQKDIVRGVIPADPNAMVEISCPCPMLDKNAKGRSNCNLVGSLSFMIPSVRIDGVYQIDTRSTNSILNLNSSLALIRSLAGQIAMIPFKLRRIPQEITYQGKTATHYILRLDHQLTVAQIQSMRGDKPMLGFGGQAEDLGPPPPDAVEELPPGDPNAKTIEIFVKDALYPEDGGRVGYAITGQEDPGENTPVLEFKTQDLEHARMAWELVKERCSATIKYKVLEDGTFEILSMEKGMPF